MVQIAVNKTVARGKWRKSKNKKKSFQFIHFIHDNNTAEKRKKKSGGVGTHNTIQDNKMIFHNAGTSNLKKTKENPK